MSRKLRKICLEYIAEQRSEKELPEFYKKVLEQTSSAMQGIQINKQTVRSQLELEKKIELLRYAKIVCTTLASSRSGSFEELMKDKFSLVIIDEATQAIEAESWIAIHNTKCKVVVAGDHNQLPPCIKSSKAAKEGLEKSILERLFMLNSGNFVCHLNVQYRMNKSIMKWSSRKLYNTSLVAHKSAEKRLLSNLPGIDNTDISMQFAATPLVLIDTSKINCPETKGQEESYYNEYEACIANAYSLMLCEQLGVESHDIGIICPYSAQKEYLLQMQTRGIVNTIDSFQGQEKEVIIISFTRSNHNKEIGFLNDIRRLNVAVTRAKSQLCLICNSQTVCHDRNIRDLVIHTIQNGLLLRVQDIPISVQKNKTLEKYPQQACVFLNNSVEKNHDVFIHCLNSLPTHQQLNNEMKQIIDAFQNDHSKVDHLFNIRFTIQTQQSFVSLCFSPSYNRLFRACVRRYCDDLGIESRTLELVEDDGIIAKYVSVIKVISNDRDVKSPKIVKLDRMST